MNIWFPVCYLSLAWKCKHWHTSRLMLSCDPMRACGVVLRSWLQSGCVCRYIPLRYIQTLSCFHSYCRQRIVNMLHGLSSLVVAADAAFPPSCHASSTRKSEATGACVTEAVMLSTKQFGSIHGSSARVWQATSEAAACHRQAVSTCGFAEGSRSAGAVAYS